jgi:endoglucanase
MAMSSSFWLSTSRKFRGICFFLVIGSLLPGFTGCQDILEGNRFEITLKYIGNDDIDDTDDPCTNHDAPLGRLRVSNGKLLDESGNQVVLKGVSLSNIIYVKYLGHWNEEYFANARSWGATLVRLPVNPATFREFPQETLLDLDDAVRWCQKHDLYLNIDYHALGNATDGLFQWEEYLGTTWEEAEQFWATVAARYADVPTVAFGEIYNEPAALGGTLTFDDWRQHADALVAILREHAPEMIPVVAGLDFAYDFSPGGSHPFSDPDIALSAHPYPGQARERRRANWEAAFGYLSDRYPIILTEIGFDPYDQFLPSAYLDDIVYGREVLSYAEEKQMSWTAWVFFNDGASSPMPLFSDWETLTPTVAGLFFKDVLLGEDIETAGDGFGERPPVVYPSSNGPSDLFWDIWADKGASIEWTNGPTAEVAGVHIESEDGASGRLQAAFSWDSSLNDMSAYNEIVIQGTVTEGEPFSVIVGRIEGHAEAVFYGCVWDLLGNGESVYTVDLLSPDWCSPESCFDMLAEGLAFSNTPSASTADLYIDINSVVFQVNPDNPLPPSGQIGTEACD